MDDFYMILSSDSCTSIHSSNSANNFTVSWEKPIDFSNTKVALTHMAIIQQAPYQFAQYAMSYGREGRNHYFEYLVTSDLRTEIIADIFPEDRYWKRHPPKVEIQQTDQSYLEIKADSKFRISWKSRWFSSMLPTLQDGKYVIVSERPIILDRNFTLALEFDIDYLEYANITLNLDGEWRTIDDMIQEVKDKTGSVFKRFHLDKDTNRMVIEFSPDSDVDWLYLENGFHELLGFDTDLLRQGSFHRAVHPHQFFYRVEQFHIYSNICQPMYVDNQRVPLLAAIFRNKKRYERLTNIVIKNPMYVNVHVTELNSIDIAIADATFFSGTKAILTLHFVYKHFYMLSQV